MKFIFYLLFLYVFLSFSLPYAQSKVLEKSVITQFNSPIDITLDTTGYDGNRDKLIPSIVSNPSHGTLSNLDTIENKVTYIPNQAFEGIDKFTYTVNNGTDDNNNVIVTITITGPPNNPPNALPSDFSTTPLNSPIEIPLEAPDENSLDDQLVVSIVNEPQNGQLNEINQEKGTVTYIPNEGFTGSDTFTYKVNDGSVDSEPVQVTIKVESPSIADDSDSGGKFNSISSYMVNELKQLNTKEVKNYPFLELNNEDISEILIQLDKGNLTKVLYNIPDNVLKEINDRITSETFDSIISELNQTVISDIHNRLI